MKAVHFGAVNIERGFIGENVHENQIEITFVDANAPLIKTLNQEKKWPIHYAAEGQNEFFAEVKKYLAPEEHEYRKQ